MSNPSLESELTVDLLRLHDRIVSATRGRFFPTHLRTAVEARGGLAAAQDILSRPLSSCTIDLKNWGRADLSIEGFIMLSPKYHTLFTDRELRVCAMRYGLELAA